MTWWNYFEIIGILSLVVDLVESFWDGWHLRELCKAWVDGISDAYLQSLVLLLSGIYINDSGRTSVRNYIEWNEHDSIVMPMS